MESLGRAEREDMGLGFVAPENPCTSLTAQGGERHAGPEAVLHRGGVGKVAEEGFSRYADEKWAGEGREGFQPREKCEIVCGGFPKTNSWIEGDAHRVEAGRYRPLEGVSKKFPNLGDNIVVAWSRLHGSRRSLHVHHDHSGTRLGGEGRHFRIPAQAGDIIDDVRASLQSSAGDKGFGGIDGNGNLGRAAESLDDRKNAPGFLFGRNSLTAGAGGFPADVENFGSFGNEREALRAGGFGIEKLPAVRKRIGRGIHNAHDHGAAREVEFAAAEFPDHFLPSRMAAERPWASRPSISLNFSMIGSEALRDFLSNITTLVRRWNWSAVRPANEWPAPPVGSS